ncbi:transcription termination/antitermination protein NusA [Verrucomicrobiota bacterium]|nr:transcription termination/antitermination protein NusA [Verrucomicrobiota bacterium]
MSVDIKPYLQYLEKEKHIPKDEACALIVEAIKSSVEKSVMSGQNVEVTADPATGKLDAHVIYSVTDSVSDPLREINPVAAALLQPGAVVGDEVRKPINVADLGRIAAKTTQQLLNQRFRKIEKDQVFLEYKDKVGDIVTGIVRRTERGNVIVELGTAEAVLTHKERCHGDEFRTGDRIRCLLLEIREDPQRGREFVLSRANDGFVRRLLELEVAEIADKTVTIAKMARDPGYRTKIAVDSSDPKVDPVGACVGARGARVRNIVKELGGEKIDIIRFHKEPLKLLEEAIRPARPRNVRIDERNRSIHFEVDEEDMRIAIGSKGRNARLTSKLMGWGLNIAKATNTPESVEAQLGEKATRLAEQLGLPFELVAKFVQLGLTEVAVAANVTAEELQDTGIASDEIQTFLAAVAKVAKA